MAMALIGAGTGGLSEHDSREAIEAGLAEFTTAALDTAGEIDVAIVSYQRTR